MKRGLFVCIFGAVLLASGMSQAQQNAYPTKQVRIVVPYPAGGPTDLIARLLSQKLGERLGQTFFVENVGGASGAVGAGQVAQAAPDGHTLLVVTNDFAVASVTNSKLPYDPVKNFAPVTIIATSPQVVAVNPSVPAKSMKELVDLIKAAPDKYNYAAARHRLRPAVRGASVQAGPQARQSGESPLQRRRPRGQLDAGGTHADSLLGCRRWRRT